MVARRVLTFRPGDQAGRRSVRADRVVPSPV